MRFGEHYQCAQLVRMSRFRETPNAYRGRTRATNVSLDAKLVEEARKLGF